MLNVPNRKSEFLAQSAYEFSRSFLGYQRGIVVVIDVYMDESGVHAGAPAVTSSAVWARPSVWRKWTAAWEKAKEPICIYHASECHNLKGEFEGWTREERNALVLKLLPTVSAHRLHGRYSGIHLDAMNRCLELDPEIKKEFGSPYYACINWAFKLVCEHAKKENHQRVAFIHEVSDFCEDIFRAFEYAQKRFPEITMTLGFGKKTDYVPLQAADLLAYEGYKFLEGGSIGRKPMAALDPTGKRMMHSIYGRDDAAVLANLLKMRLSPMIDRKLSGSPAGGKNAL